MECLFAGLPNDLITLPCPEGRPVLVCSLETSVQHRSMLYPIRPRACQIWVKAKAALPALSGCSIRNDHQVTLLAWCSGTDACHAQ